MKFVKCIYETIRLSGEIEGNSHDEININKKNKGGFINKKEKKGLLIN